jgi:hypothetical protein
VGAKPICSFTGIDLHQRRNVRMETALVAIDLLDAPLRRPSPDYPPTRASD